MRRFKFKKVDAFATARSDGNPAGYVTLRPGEEISAGEMHRIANRTEAKTDSTSLRLGGDQSGAVRVLFGGGAVARIEGEYILS